MLPEHPLSDPLNENPRLQVQAHSLAARRGVRLLLVGRRTTADKLATILQGAKNSANPLALLPQIEVVVLTNQKMALQEIRVQPPKVVLVELEDKVESRRRFCDMVHYRLPTALIYAVCVTTPKSSFPFDGVLQLPLHDEEVWAALRNVQDEVGDYVLQRGPIRLNVATRTVVSVNGQRHMTPKQCALLQYLMMRANEVVSRSEIMEAIWETDYLEDTRTLDVHIRWLRECIEPDPSQPIYLVTERGKGYRLKIVE